MKSEQEKVDNLSSRFKILNLIRDVKNYAISEQSYELAAQIRDFERDLEKSDWENESRILVNLYDYLQNMSIETYRDKDKDYLKSLLRDRKIEIILKKPLK